MKKKIKLYAWERDKVIFWIVSGDECSTKNYCDKRRPEFDIEKEIEVPDESKKAREFWIDPHDFSLIKFATNKHSNCIHVREVLPEENKRKREAMAKVFKEYGYSTMSYAFKALVKAAGLDE